VLGTAFFEIVVQAAEAANWNISSEVYAFSSVERYRFRRPSRHQATAVTDVNRDPVVKVERDPDEEGKMTSLDGEELRLMWDHRRLQAHANKTLQI
jgi:hypothetical protein